MNEIREMDVNEIRETQKKQKKDVNEIKIKKDEGRMGRGEREKEGEKK